MSNRREFITLLGGAAVAWPLAARAQAGKTYTIGRLTAGSFVNPLFEAFDNALRGMGCKLTRSSLAELDVIMKGFGDYQRAHAKRVDPRIGQLSHRLREMVDILEQVMLYPYSSPAQDQSLQPKVDNPQSRLQLSIQ